MGMGRILEEKDLKFCIERRRFERLSIALR